MGPLVASSVHIPPILSQNALNRQNYCTVTEILETADNVMLLAKLDVSNHNGPYTSMAAHNIPELGILRHVWQSSSKYVTQFQICGI
jgi:hypothetical protein